MFSGPFCLKVVPCISDAAADFNQLVFCAESEGQRISNFVGLIWIFRMGTNEQTDYLKESAFHRFFNAHYFHELRHK